MPSDQIITTLKLDTTSLFKQRSTRPITYQEAHNELLEAYDATLGLDTGESHVGMSEFENPVMGSLYEIWYATYLREQIGEHFRLSFDEFLDRPRWQIMIMLEAVRRRMAILNKDIQQQIDDNKEMRGLEKEMQGRT